MHRDWEAPSNTVRVMKKTHPTTPAAEMEKRPFDIPEAFRLIREAVKDVPKAAMFELAEEGYHTVFELLVGCIISIRICAAMPIAPRA